MSEKLQNPAEKMTSINMAAFLENSPPGQLFQVNDLGTLRDKNLYLAENTSLYRPDIRLHCSHENCNGTRTFRPIDRGNKYLKSEDYDFVYLEYLCSNCQVKHKTFSLAVRIWEDACDADVSFMHEPGYKIGESYKFGELPAFGPVVPSKLLKLVGSDRDNFFKGRRCENQGLGVGAFAYYRRVVENQKNKILGEVIRVSEKVGAGAEVIEQFEKAKQETQFTTALKFAKGAIPQSLLISGHNPFLLLHDALSDGIHGHTDEECLEIAASIRVILSELSERLDQALKDDSEVTKALQALMIRKQK